MKLVVNADFLELEPLLRDLPAQFERQGTIIYKSRNELRSIDLNGFTINVKRYRVPILVNRIAYTFFRKSKANRAYDYALKLIEKGIGTPAPIAYLEYKSQGLLSHSYFVSRHIQEYRLMREFADGSDITERKDIVEALGVFIAKLHQAGILHLDLSVGNILFKKDGQEIHFWLVDLNRMQFTKIEKELGCKNFERLRGSQAFFEVLASSYANAQGFDPSECLEAILKHQKKSVLKFRAKAERNRILRKYKLKR